MKTLNLEAWEYLKKIKERKWTIIHDKSQRRWGNLTTNISESFNNTLRGVRLMPIKAIINCTFEKTVEQYRKHNEIATNCNTSLPPRLWRLFQSRDLIGQQHVITEFDHQEARYRVLSRLQTNEGGGNVYTVEFNDKTCTCGKWQMLRFPCSHAIAVCRQRGVSPNTTVHQVYTTAVYQAQYNDHFYPLRHPDYWTDPGWKIRADPSRLTTKRGRRRTRRIHNEMDVRHPDEPVVRRCSICRQAGHNMNTCRNSQP
ncbi:hypothetical protein QVD17_13094 [Tagetes erecta]|uniref:SWIM-type domain-containing protein n=1 Tax=Tagetes erecta TaxID=13708 RepID=A0AAD8L062_TARER|nr:hypothetical protein QVD17_13094 [Tagetes erecta]